MIDCITAGTQAILGFLAKSAYFTATVRPGNRLNFIGGKPWPEKKGRNAGDWPEFQIRNAGSMLQGFTGNNSQKTFGNTAPTAGTLPPTDFIVEDTVTYEVIITHDGVDEVTPDKLLTEIKSVFLNAGINLGLSIIKTWGPINCRNERKSNAMKAGTLGLVQTITIPVLFRLHRADVISA